MTDGQRRSQWTVLADRPIGQLKYERLSVASIEQPDGFRFEQYVLRMPRGAMTVVLDDAAERVLLIWRHRFVTGRWVWELPGGHVEDGEDGAAAAAREVLEETGYRPGRIEHVLTFQPMPGTADSPYEIYLARGAEPVGVPDINETEEVRWVPLAEVAGLIASGDISGAATIIGLQHALLTR